MRCVVPCRAGLRGGREGVILSDTAFQDSEEEERESFLVILRFVQRTAHLCYLLYMVPFSITLLLISCDVRNED